MKARVCNLHKTEAEWAKLNTLIPEAGELIVYDPDDKHNYARIKIGDGKKSLKDLDFLIDSAVTALMQSEPQKTIDGGRITNYK